MAKEIDISELSRQAAANGGTVYTHYWSDIQGLRWALLDKGYKYDGVSRSPQPLGEFDLREIPAGWIGNCYQFATHHKESADHVKLLQKLGINDLNIRHNIARLGEPIMIATGRKFGKKVPVKKLYKLPKNGEIGYYYSSDEIYKTAKPDTLLRVVFSAPTYRGTGRIEHEGTRGFGLYRLGSGLLNVIAGWAEE